MEEQNMNRQTSESVVTKVTKHPGRVAAGKRLAEWNKNKKINEQTKKQILEPNEEPMEKSLETTLPQTMSSNWKLSSYMILSVTAAGAFGYLLYNQYIKQQITTKPELLDKVSNKPLLDQEIPKSKQPSINPDPFIMH